MVAIDEPGRKRDLVKNNAHHKVLKTHNGDFNKNRN